MDAVTLADLDPDGGDWTPGPPWLDRLMTALGLVAFVLLTLAAYAGNR